MSKIANKVSSSERPYPPSWFDRFTQWIDRMPGPNYLYYIGLGLVQFGYVVALLWFNDRLSGSLGFRPAVFIVVAPYFLWVRHALDGVAAAALDAFAAHVSLGDADVARLRYELTTLPARPTRIVTTVAAGLFVLNTALLPKSVLLQYSPSAAATMIEFGPIVFFTVVVTVVAFFHALHQLRMVDRIHDMVTTVDLLRTKSLHVFSGLTSRTGVSFLLIAYYVAAVRPDFVSQSPLLQALLLAVVPIAVACFVLPLRGMHRRLAAEKERALAEVTGHLQELFKRLHDQVDRGVLEEADKLNMQITGLVTERDLLSRVSTWPWDPAALAGFVSALVVPVILWVVQRLLGQAL